MSANQAAEVAGAAGSPAAVGHDTGLPEGYVLPGFDVDAGVGRVSGGSGISPASGAADVSAASGAARSVDSVAFSGPLGVSVAVDDPFSGADSRVVDSSENAGFPGFRGVSVPLRYPVLRLLPVLPPVFPMLLPALSLVLRALRELHPRALALSIRLLFPAGSPVVWPLIARRTELCAMGLRSRGLNESSSFIPTARSAIIILRSSRSRLFAGWLMRG